MAEAFGYSPREVDGLNVRDLAVMLHAGIRKVHSGWQQAALVSTKVHNMGGPRGKSFDPKQPVDLYPDIFQGGQTSDESWEEEMRETFKRYNPNGESA